MGAFLALFDIVPGWVYALIVGGLLVHGSIVEGQRDGARLEVAQKNEQIATDKAERLKLVADHNLKIARLQADHATKQQEITDGFAKEILKLQADRALAVARADSVQQRAEAAAARDRSDSEGDPAARQRVADHNGKLYALVTEGFRLVEEGRGLLAERDQQVRTLKAVIANDREQICGGAPK